MRVLQMLDKQKRDYAVALETAERELDALLLKRATIDVDIAKTQSTVKSLCVLTGKKVPPTLLQRPGNHFTHLVRKIVMDSQRPLGPREIRAQLLLMGVSLDEYNNPLSTIGNALRRLQKQGELRREGNNYGNYILNSLD